MAAAAARRALRRAEPGSRRPSRASKGTARPAATRSAVTAPASSARSTARSTAAASSSRPQAEAQQHRRREDRSHRVGDAAPRDVGRRAVHRLVEAEGARRRATPTAACRASPTSTDASSLRMSPNMLPASTTSNDAGRRIRCMAQESTSACSSSTSGYSRATRDHGRAPQPHRRQHVRLVDRGELLAAPARGGERDARDALHLARRCRAWCRRRSVPLALLLARAEVGVAGELAHEQDVDAVEQLGADRREVHQALVDRDRPQVGEQLERLAQREQAVLGAHRARSGPPTWVRPRRRGRAPSRARTRRASRRAAACRSRRWRCRRSRTRRSRAAKPRAAATASRHARGPRPPPRGRCRRRAGGRCERCRSRGPGRRSARDASARTARPPAAGRAGSRARRRRSSRQCFAKASIGNGDLGAVGQGDALRRQVDR